MKSDIDIILFLLETLRFRHKLEEQLINNLSKLNSKNISRSQLEELYGEKVNEELLASTESALRRIGVLVQNNDKLIIDPIKLERFKELIETAKAARDYKWPSINPKPFLYVSPPSLITSNVSSEVDDIANLLVNLVRSAEQNISIMSPFTNESGLQSVFAPLQACKNTPEISIYLISYTKNKDDFAKQVSDMVPERMRARLKIYFCSTELIEADNLPHAKVLIVDNKKGYLGSANFTKQGLTSRFELGVELQEDQSKTVNKMLDILIKKSIFELHKFS